MIDLNEIVLAWIKSFNPSDDVKELSLKRLEICNSCDSNKEIFKDKKWSRVCTECGCPIRKKIFSHKIEDACDLGKWNAVDNEFNNKKSKLI